MQTTLIDNNFYDNFKYNEYEKISKDVKYLFFKTSNIKDLESKGVVFGVQAFIKEFLIDIFNKQFFKKNKDTLLKEISEHLKLIYDDIDINISKYELLYDLGYLPIEIKCLSEGTHYSVDMPILEISNTHEDFAWIVNALKPIIIKELQKYFLSASLSFKYFKVINDWALKTCSVKALTSEYNAISASFNNSYVESWALNNFNIYVNYREDFLKYFYNTKDEINKFKYLTINNEIYDKLDEETILKKYLIEKFKDKSFSVTSNTYGHWNFIKKVLPQCKKEIEEHNGCLFIEFKDPENLLEDSLKTINELIDTFGYSINDKGYKTLNSKIKLICEGNFSPSKLNKLYELLEKKDLASNNIIIKLNFNDDNLTTGGDESIIKSNSNFKLSLESSYNIVKDNKTHTQIKNTIKGCCVVLENLNGLYCHDGLNFQDTYNNLNKLEVIFKDGKMIKEYSLKEIRDRLWGSKFYE